MEKETHIVIWLSQFSWTQFIHRLDITSIAHTYFIQLFCIEGNIALWFKISNYLLLLLRHGTKAVEDLSAILNLTWYFKENYQTFTSGRSQVWYYERIWSPILLWNGWEIGMFVLGLTSACSEILVQWRVWQVEPM